MPTSSAVNSPVYPYSDQGTAMTCGAARVTDYALTFATDGHTEWVESVKKPVCDSAGKIIAVLGIARDITAHRQMTAALEERLAMLTARRSNRRMAAYSSKIPTAAFSTRISTSVICLASIATRRPCPVPIASRHFRTRLLYLKTPIDSWRVWIAV